MTFITVKQIEIEGYGTFHIRRTSALLRRQVNTLLADPALKDDERERRMRNLIFSSTLVDEAGKRIYTEEQLEQMIQTDPAPDDLFINKIIDEASKLNNPPEQIKNSAPSPTATSPSA